MQILITIPIRTATEERYLSTVRCHKIYLRNTSSQVRLNGMGMLNTHRDIWINSEIEVDEMAKISKQIIHLK